MKMVEFFIPRKSSQRFNHAAPCAVKRAGVVDGIRAGLSRQFDVELWSEKQAESAA